MGKDYFMRVTISGVNKDYIDDIIQACLTLWDFQLPDIHGWPNDLYMCFEGRDVLSGGKSECAFEEELRDAIWKANKAFCEITISPIFLETDNSISFMQEDYDDWLTEQ